MFQFQMVVGQQQQQQKSPRRRIIFTQAQLAYFEQEYIKNPYANQDRQQFLAHQLGITKERVKIWFQNRRAKDKRSQTDHPVVMKRRAGQTKREMDHSEAEESRRFAGSQLEKLFDFGRQDNNSFITPKKEIPDKIDSATPAPTPRKKKSPRTQFPHIDPMYPYNNYLVSMTPGLQMMQQPFSYQAPFGMLPNPMPQFMNSAFSYQMPTPPFSPFPGVENIVQPVVFGEESKKDKGPEEPGKGEKLDLTTL